MRASDPKAMIATQTTILVVDDDDHFRETLSDAMALKDVRVEGAVSVRDALRCLSQHRPSLIILDVQLPDMNGFELCRALKKDERFRDVPVVLLSAKYTEPADRAEGLLTGADAFLSKPISLESLWDEVCYLLDR
ncbi:MAG TPA: two-component system response regulator [Elusimicrobia bacterium]|nr:two-component system response regulator [Elusimicrobiota bacterium]